jgi:hypothetical protein
MLPTIDMPEPMQEAVPAFVVGSSLAAACSATECCGCAIFPMASAAFAVALLSFSGALLLKLFNMSTSFFRRRKTAPTCNRPRRSSKAIARFERWLSSDQNSWKMHNRPKVNVLMYGELGYLTN